MISNNCGKSYTCIFSNDCQFVFFSCFDSNLKKDSFDAAVRSIFTPVLRCYSNVSLTTTFSNARCDTPLWSTVNLILDRIVHASPATNLFEYKTILRFTLMSSQFPKLDWLINDWASLMFWINPVDKTFYLVRFVHVLVRYNGVTCSSLFPNLHNLSSFGLYVLNSERIIERNWLHHLMHDMTS